VAWERDAAHTGSIAARLWAAANDETRKGFYEDCGVTELTITVDNSNTNNCGTGGTGGGDCIVTITNNLYNTGGSTCLPLEDQPQPPPYMPPLERDDDGNILPPETLYPDEDAYDGDDYDRDRCLIAQYGFRRIREWIYEWHYANDLAATVAAIILFIASDGVAGVVAVIGMMSASELATLAFRSLALMRLFSAWDDFVDGILNVLDDARDDLICSIYGALDTHAGVVEWVAWYIDEIIGWASAENWWVPALETPMRQFLESLLPITPLAELLRMAAISQQPPFVAFDCSNCGGGDCILPDASLLAAGYELVPLPLEDYACENGDCKGGTLSDSPDNPGCKRLYKEDAYLYPAPYIGATVDGAVGVVAQLIAHGNDDMQGGVLLYFVGDDGREMWEPQMWQVAWVDNATLEENEDFNDLATYAGIMEPGGGPWATIHMDPQGESGSNWVDFQLCYIREVT